MHNNKCMLLHGVPTHFLIFLNEHTQGWPDLVSWLHTVHAC